MTEALTQAAASAGVTTQSQVSRTQLAEDMDTFLTLLTTQLANQDPLSPMDSTEFTNQLVQFAQVEQQINQNENLEDLLGITANNQAAMAVGYLGKFVEAESNAVTLEDGQGVFTYGLSTEAASVTVGLYDEGGILVRSFTGDPAAGLHKIEWDGTDNEGNMLDDGSYTISVTATPIGDEEVETWTTSLGRVTGVATDGEGGTLLALGETTVDLIDVLGVFETLPGATQAVTDGTTTADTDSDTGDGDGDGEVAETEEDAETGEDDTETAEDSSDETDDGDDATA